MVTGDYPFKDVDRATFVWVTQVRANATKLNITGDMIMLKASKFATMLGVSTAVSSGWLTGFLNRYGLTSVRRCGERRSFVVTDEIRSRIEYIKRHLSDFELESIVNADETALFYKTVSSRTYKVAAEDSKNSKRSKERVTVMVCCAANGFIYDLQVIHTPRSLGV